MALTSFGNGVTDMRGSISGNTYTRTKAGAMTRARVKPTNPQSEAQLEQRSILTELSTYWAQTLTQAQRDGWNEFGVAFPSTNKLGAVINLAGFNAFQRCNGALMAAGLAILNAAPADQDVSELQTLAVTMNVGAGASNITWTATGTLTDDVLVIRSTPGISPGISNFTNKLRYVAADGPDPESPLAWESLFIDRFGGLPLVGQKVGIEAQFLRSTNGAFSSILRATCIVTSSS